ncbi:MAG: helix-turn-helix domain-containing protein [Lachnospiraceae bacterium]
MSPSDYLLERRIARAKILLATTDESISSISSRFCFSSRSHFSSRFTAMVSMSPSEYRRRYRIGPRKDSGKD